MKRREMLVATGRPHRQLEFSLELGRCRRQPKTEILYFTRNVGFYHSVVQRPDDSLAHSEKALIEMGQRVGIEVDCSKDGRVFDQGLDKYDAIAFYTNGDLTVPNEQNEPPMTAAGKQRLLDFVRNGKGFVGFHSACACWRTPGDKYATSSQVDPYLAMLGAEFIAHDRQQMATMRVVSRQFPGVKGLGDSFQMHEEWYAMKNFASDLHVILAQETEGMEGECYQRPPFPSTWARRHGKGRVYFTSMAHRENVWLEEPFQQIVLGGLAWVLGNVDADIPANIDTVTPKANQTRNE